ncbi:glycosyltransferase [Candidatus Wolfebacteria bacterium]|nr:glycosyltransferase [Candidatus Wolfebacteria bacterium]
MDKRLKLLVLTQVMDMNDPVLGFFHRWVEEFAKHCESVIVICLYEGEHALPKNVQVLSLGKESCVSRLKYLYRFFTYIWQERKNYDAVFVHMNQIYVILGGVLWRLWGKWVSWWYAHGATSFSMWLAEKCTDIVFTSTPEGFRMPSKKLHIVGQGIDTDMFVPAPHTGTNKGLIVVTTGRISRVKYLELLIDAVEVAVERIPDVQLHIYGAPQTADEEVYHKELQQQVAAKRLTNIFFEGAVLHTALPKILQGADVFVQASQTGSLDKAVLEALATDIPVVSTNRAFKAFPGVLYTAHNASAVAEHVVMTCGQGGARNNIVKSHSIHNLATNIVRTLSSFERESRTTEREPLTNVYARRYYDDYLEKHTESYSESRWFSSDAARFDYEQTKRALIAALEDRKFAKALEIGPGDGAWTPYIAARSGSLTLLEQSEQMRRRVGGLIKEKGLANVTVVGGSFPIDVPAQKYDLVVSVRAFEYFEDKAAAFKTLAALLAPDGRVVIITKNPHYVALHGKPHRTLHDGQIGPRIFIELARAAGFTVESVYPATLRWLVRFGFFRTLFDTLHAWSVLMRTGTVVPVLARYTSESYLYVLTKNGD